MELFRDGRPSAREPRKVFTDHPSRPKSSLTKDSAPTDGRLLQQMFASKKSRKLWKRELQKAGRCGLPKSSPVRKDGSKAMNIFNRTKPLQPVTLSFEEIVEYEAAFRAVDLDHDGNIDVHELGNLLSGVGLRPSEEEIADMIKLVDNDNDQALNICEFINLMSRQHNPFVTPCSQFKAVFRVFDTDNNGHLNKEEFKDLIFSLGQKCSESELKTLMDFLDKDKDGSISETEFLKFFLTDSPQWLERLTNLDNAMRQQDFYKTNQYGHMDFL